MYVHVRVYIVMFNNLLINANVEIQKNAYDYIRYSLKLSGKSESVKVSVFGI